MPCMDVLHIVYESSGPGKYNKVRQTPVRVDLTLRPLNAVAVVVFSCPIQLRWFINTLL